MSKVHIKSLSRLHGYIITYDDGRTREIKMRGSRSSVLYQIADMLREEDTSELVKSIEYIGEFED